MSSFVLPDVADGDEVQISFVFGIDSCSGFNGWEVFEYVVFPGSLFVIVSLHFWLRRCVIASWLDEF